MDRDDVETLRSLIMEDLECGITVIQPRGSTWTWALCLQLMVLKEDRPWAWVHVYRHICTLSKFLTAGLEPNTCWEHHFIIWCYWNTCHHDWNTGNKRDSLWVCFSNAEVLGSRAEVIGSNTEVLGSNTEVLDSEVLGSNGKAPWFSC